MSAGIDGLSAGMESSYKFSAEIHNSVTSSREDTWSKETSTEFTAPPYRFYEVRQTMLNFASPYQLDNCSLYSRERVSERWLGRRKRR